MAKYPFRILLETVEGSKTSYYSSSFVDTSDNMVLSSSQVYNRITGSVSSSYQNQTIFSGSDFNTSFTFKDNNILSASLSGSLESGSIFFTSTDSEYDRLLRYKFFGEKVCNVLGLPSNEWIYADQFRLPSDDESNFFEGNVKAKNIFIEDDFTFTGTSNLNSDLPILVDTGSDRYVRFQDVRGIPTNALFMGYNNDLDSYHFSASVHFPFRMEGINEYTGSNSRIGTIDAGKIYVQGTGLYSSRDEGIVLGSDGNILLKPGKYIATHNQAEGNPSVDTSDRHRITFADGIKFIVDDPLTEILHLTKSRVGVNIGDEDEITHTLTVGGDISASGNIFAQEFHTLITSSSIIFSSGSTIFGDTLDDVHSMTGSLKLTGSIEADGKVGIGKTSPTSPLEVVGNISASGNIFLESGKGVTNTSNPDEDYIAFVNQQAGGYSGLFISSSNAFIGAHTDLSKEDIPKLLTVAGDISSSGDIYLEHNKNIFLTGDDDVSIKVSTGGIDLNGNDGDSISLNGGDKNCNIVLRSENNSSMLFVDADTDRIGIGTGTPAKTLTVAGEVSSSKAMFVQGTDLDFQVSASTKTLIQISGDVSSSGDWYGAGSGIKVSGSTAETTLLTVTHPETGSLFEVKATPDSGSIVISGSILLKDNNLVPSVSESRIYNSGSNLYFGNHAGTNDFSIGPKVLQTYSHNFSDDPSTGEHGLPWADSFENLNQYDEQASFLCTTQTNVRHVLMRGQGWDQNMGGTITWRVKTHSPYGVTVTNEANWTTKETTIVTIPGSTDVGATNLIYATFSGSHCEPGDLLFVGFEFSADFTSGADEFYVSSTVEHDYNTLPTLGFTTGSMPTGSAGFGV